MSVAPLSAAQALTTVSVPPSGIVTGPDPEIVPVHVEVPSNDFAPAPVTVPAIVELVSADACAVLVRVSAAFTISGFVASMLFTVASPFRSTDACGAAAGMHTSSVVSGTRSGVQLVASFQSALVEPSQVILDANEHVPAACAAVAEPTIDTTGAISATRRTRTTHTRVSDTTRTPTITHHAVRPHGRQHSARHEGSVAYARTQSKRVRLKTVRLQ